ncbi:MAG: cytochrome c [Desulfobaccales bacterium]
MRIRLFLAGLMLVAGGAWAQELGDLVKQGQQIFENNCAQCHLKSGKGLPGTFPALDKDPFVIGDPKPVLATVLHGRKGTLGQMPSWKDNLDNRQVAAVVTFIRQAWSNRAPAVTPAMAGAARGK